MHEIEPTTLEASNILSLEHAFTLLHEGELDSLERSLKHLNPGQIADLLEAMPPKERKQLWELACDDVSAEILTFLHEEVRNNLIEDMTTEELVEAAEQMDVDDLAGMFQLLPEQARQNLEEHLSTEIRERLETNLSFEDGTAGRMMSPDVISVRGDISLGVVKRYLHRYDNLPDYTDGLMVIDREGVYQGKLLLNKVLTGEDDTLVKDVMNTQHHPVQATTTEHDIVMIFEQSNFISLAVVDEKYKLLGRITMDDSIDILRAEADHALMGQAGLNEDEDLFAPVFNSAKRRTVWLAINLVTAFLAAWVIGLFSGALEKLVALAVLMPIVASMGGIAGSQTLTLTIRGLALNQISSGNRFWLTRKELLIGIINGVIWATVVAVIAWLWFQDTGISLVIGAAIVINLIAAAGSGIAVPLILQRFGIDPALSGAVILTTVTDVVGFMSFLGLATIYLL